MSRLSSLAITGSIAALGLLASASDAAAAERCSRIHVVAAADLPLAFAKAVDELRATLSQLTDVECVDATLVVTRDAARARLDVSAADGRRASRSVAEPGVLDAVAYGVLASIPPEVPRASEPAETPAGEATVSAASVPEEAPSASSPTLARAPASPDRARSSGAGSEPASPRTSMSFGVTFGTRIGMPTGIVSPEVELRGDAAIERWVVSLSGRAAVDGTRLGATDDVSEEQTDISVGLLGGRWFELAGGIFTLSAGPRIGVITEETDLARRTRRDWWLQAAARWIMPVGERWRPALALETEVAPMHLAEASSANALPFPSWTAGLRIGVVGGVR